MTCLQGIAESWEWWADRFLRLDGADVQHSMGRKLKQIFEHNNMAALQRTDLTGQ